MNLLKAYFYTVLIGLSILIIALCNNLFISLFVILFTGFGIFSYNETLKSFVDKTKADIYTEGE